MKLFRKFLAAGLFLAVAAEMGATALLAQTSEAQITGIVKDKSGGVIPGAEAKIENPAAGITRLTVTDSAPRRLHAGGQCPAVQSQDRKGHRAPRRPAGSPGHRARGRAARRDGDGDRSHAVASGGGSGGRIRHHHIAAHGAAPERAQLRRAGYPGAGCDGRVL